MVNESPKIPVCTGKNRVYPYPWTFYPYPTRPVTCLPDPYPTRGYGSGTGKPAGRVYPQTPTRVLLCKGRATWHMDI